AILPSLCEQQKAELAEKEMEKLLYDIEQPLARVLASMETIGFVLDDEGLREYGEELTARAQELTQRIYYLAGGEFNVNSPKQLGEVLFEWLGLPTGKKTKKGYSTNADTLESLRNKHPIIEDIIAYRKLAKLISTYVEGLLNQLDDDGRVRSRFRQTETRTGRISSSEPNLQNIPVRTELGSRMRRFFKAPEGFKLVDADYSQIELRVLAHISDDPAMLAAFESGEDIHTKTAAQVFDMPEAFVTPQMRSSAKAVNFGIVYGIGAFSLARDIGVSVAEADRYIKSYLATYKGVEEYMKDTIAFGKSHGYVKTLFNRRRPVAELVASNHITRAAGERIAMNTPIQGTAADIIKLAMVRVFERLKKEKLRSRLILQVHDELIVEAPDDEAEKVAAILAEEMESAVSLKVKMPADSNIGDNWLEAK
ncbi:MAG: DNA polymerase I, partial [Oscillospiraceae bacterium]|nr:DNA polymerase I [Oscillospiraceae bacterium]